MPKTYHLSDYQIPDYLITHTDLTIDLSQEPVQSRSRLTIKPNPEKANRNPELILDGQNMKLHSIQLNGHDLLETDYILTDVSLTIKNAPTEEFTIQCEAVLGDNPDLFGLYQTEGTYLVKAETEGMRRVLYCLDRPDVLSTYTTTLIADKKNYPVLLANGVRTNLETLSEGKHAVTWHDPLPKPTYLFALVAGQLEQSEIHFTTQSGRNMPIQFYVPPDTTTKCDFAKEVLIKAFRWDEETFGLECDLPQHMVAGVDKYASGASEPTGLNLFNLQYLFTTPSISTDTDFLFTAEVMSHESFHYWSGDRVTIRDWHNLTYKEGLTTYRAAMFLEELFGEDLIRIMDGKALHAQAPRPDSYNAVRSLYTAAAYEKGADIFRMMMLTIGKEKFLSGMNKFFHDYDGQAVTVEDLIHSLSQSSGCDLSSFLVWFTEPGIPEMEVKDSYDSTTQRYTLKIKQSSGAADYKIRPIPVTMGLLDRSGSEIVGNTTLLVDQEEMEFHFDNISSCPVPSLLRSFSAPVNLKYHYSSSDLLFLIRHDSNLYNRYEASRKLIMTLVKEHCAGKPIQLEEAFGVYQELLNNRAINSWVLAEILSFPSEEELIALVDKPDFEKIHEAHDFLTSALANHLKPDLENRLRELLQQPDETETSQFSNFDIKEAGRRRLKNCCLTYLSKVDSGIMNVADEQFLSSLGNNMTETLDALKLLTNMSLPSSKTALEQFYQHWREDANAIKYWFRIQAAAHSPDVIDNVGMLMKHPEFDITNPNKVSALFGPFMRNPVGFHALSGEGYQLVANLVVELDGINPALASQFVSFFTNWNKYDDQRQQLMFEQLVEIDQKTTSDQVKTLVAEGLAKGNPLLKIPPADAFLKWMGTTSQSMPMPDQCPKTPSPT